MRRSLLLLLLCLPVRAFAQQEDPSLELGEPWRVIVIPPPPAPGIVGVDPEILVLARDVEDTPRVVRSGPRGARHVSFARSFGNAAGGFGLGAAAGFLGGMAIGAAMCGNTWDCFGFLILGGGFGAVALAPFGAVLGAWGFGDLRGGTGNGWASLGLGLLGAGIGVGIGFGLVFASFLAGVVAGPILGAMTTILGAALGYHVSQQDVTIEPSISRPEQGDGLVLGARGAF